MLVSSMVAFRREGFIVGRTADQVEVTATAREAMGDADNVVFLRKAPLFVQLKDMLALHQRDVSGYATTTAA
ncbi:MAG: hypothetical protein FJX76_26035 [Armatimonadetes bacterium]|nr:hypothetical protein [Armatimonadota bacterium]